MAATTTTGTSTNTADWAGVSSPQRDAATTASATPLTSGAGYASAVVGHKITTAEDVASMVNKAAEVLADHTEEAGLAALRGLATHSTGTPQTPSLHTDLARSASLQGGWVTAEDNEAGTSAAAGKVLDRWRTAPEINKTLMAKFIKEQQMREVNSRFVIDEWTHEPNQLFGKPELRSMFHRLLLEIHAAVSVARFNHSKSAKDRITDEVFLRKLLGLDQTDKTTEAMSKVFTKSAASSTANKTPDATTPAVANGVGVLAPPTPAERTAQSQKDTQIAALQKQLQQVQANANQWQQQAQQTSQPPPVQQQQNGKLCRNCESPHHLQAQCPRRNANNNNANGQRKCYKCQNYGHLAAECALNNVNNNGAGNGGGQRGRKRGRN